MKRWWMMFAIASMASLHGVPATSVNYAMTPEVLDAGGGGSSSANYSNQSSIGTIGQTVAFSAYTSRPGFPGQLYDRTSTLLVVLSPASVAENASRALGVQVVADDTTRVDLPASSVTWTTSGLISVSAGGVLTAGAVYQDEPATIYASQGTASGQLAITVNDVDLDNFGLYASDGMEDFWQVGYFGVNQPNGGPLVDADGDGQNNLMEFLATTSPVDRASRLTWRIENVVGQPLSKKLLFAPFSEKRTYVVEWSDDLLTWQNLKDYDEGIQGPEHYFTDLDAKGVRRFYRLRIAP